MAAGVLSSVLGGAGAAGGAAGGLGGLLGGGGAGTAGAANPFHGVGPLKSFQNPSGGGLGGLGGMGGGGAGQLVGGLINNGAGGGKGRAAGGAKDMGGWAFQYAHPYENDPQGMQLSPLMNLVQGGQGMSQAANQLGLGVRPSFANGQAQGLKNQFIQNLLAIGQGRFGGR